MNANLENLDVTSHSEIISFLRKAFSDYFEFDDVMIPLLTKILNQLPESGISMESTRTLLERVGINIENAFSAEQKKQNERIKIVLTTCYVLLLASTPEVKGSFYLDVSSLLVDFPDFQKVEDNKELQYLLAFRNYMITALRIVPAKNNKIFLLKVVERLEGSEEEYITGTGQKPAVTRRISIYEKEGNIKAKTYKCGSNSNNNSSLNLLELAANSGDKKQKRKREVTVVSNEITAESGIDDLWSSPPLPAQTHSDSADGAFPLEAVLALASMNRHTGKQHNIMDRQLSEVAAGIPHLDANSHNKLLHEQYKGSFTEFIQQSEIMM
jgi:hypothetical protein